MNLYNQFQLLRAQVDGLNESIEPRKLLHALFCYLPPLCDSAADTGGFSLVRVGFNCKGLCMTQLRSCWVKVNIFPNHCSYFQ